MNLNVSQRHEARHLRFDVSGLWEYNDALALAYQVKAAGLRQGAWRVLVDLRDVAPSRAVQGKFLVWDRLHRALPGHWRVALVASPELVDVQERGIQGAASVVLFTSERPARIWLDGEQAPPRKNPPVRRAEGQVAGKET